MPFHSGATLGRSEEQLAAAANVSTGVIRDYERGFSRPHRNNLAQIVRAFETAGVGLLVLGTRVLVLPPPSPVSMAVAAD